ncbi:site-specific integrase [Nocardioides maradonensis]
MAHRFEKSGFGSIRRLPSGRHQARYTGPTGEIVAAPTTFDAKIDALAWLAAERKHVEDPGSWLAPKARLAAERAAAEEAERNRPPLFADYAEIWLRERRVKGRPLASETIRKHRTQLDLRLLPVFGALRLDEITPQMVNVFFDDLFTAGHSEKVRRETYSTGSAILSTAVSAHGPLVGRVSPFAIRGAGSGSTPKRHTFATAAEVAQLADLVPSEMRIVVLLAAWCGLRAGEIQALRRSDLDLAAKPPVIRIRRSYDPHAQAFKTPKSDAGVRDQHVPEHLLEPLRAHLKSVMTGPEGLLVPSYMNTGHPISRDTWNGRLKCVTCGKKSSDCASAQRSNKQSPDRGERHEFQPQMNGWYAARSVIGRDDLHLHDLRAAGATQLARLGYQVSEIQAWLGDSTPEAALRYIRATDDRKARMAADLSRIASAVTSRAPGLP